MASLSLVCSAGMASHPPVPISELADHSERLKANDNLKFSQEYEVGVLLVFSWKASHSGKLLWFLTQIHGRLVLFFGSARPAVPRVAF